MTTKNLIIVLAIGLFSATSVIAQEKKQKEMKHDSMKTETNHSKMDMKTMYTCPMHADVKSDKPGECTKCGMDLKKMKMDHSKMAKTYTCSMHPEVISKDPGKCPKCGMKLMKKKMEMKKMDKKKEDAHKGHKH